jgi:uncharacterized membrane protein YedE/YeeE
MMLLITSFVSGIIFAIGLALSGMTDPQKVLGFLDVFGAWDPSLIFVMGSAIPVYFISWQVFTRHNHCPYLDTKSHVPTNKIIDRKLILGAVIFGIGWGVSGICPGPAIASVGALSGGAAVFLICYFIGARIEAAVDHKF